ncbi:hypothetical protein PRZ48_009565 [Zasmidium cellare]|uniref:NAD(P)-binding domain-containing protein n=1 Tax=Zasmidium cellare TaxID=395010 RepID=A0ABR0ECW9_ZASCE|nr:hypothetical protein PRZ48_009565 [Zasmidium cellare]
MAADVAGWSSGGSSLPSRFFIDDNLWRDAPLLTGQTSFEPLPDVKNILVTGGEGFIASWLVRHLVLKYPTAYNIICFDKLDYCSSLNNSRMLEGRPNFKFFHGDLLKPGDVLRCLRKYEIDTVFHLAAQSHVDLSFGNSYSFTNSEVYGEVETDAEDLTEHSVLSPTNPYAASKAAAEMFVTAYVNSFRLPAVIIRLNNVYGPHQFPEKIIPKFINLLQRHKPLYIHGSGHNTRRFLYAGDAADAFDTILHRGEIGRTYNVDSRDEISNLDLAQKLISIFGGEGAIQHTKDRPFNDKRYAVDGSKLRQLGWKPRVSFEEGLASTVQWYGKFSGWWGEIESILSPFPEVVKKDGHDGEGEGERSKSGQDGDAAILQADVGAEKIVGAGGCGVSNGKANGVNGASSKKRKADAMEDDE